MSNEERKPWHQNTPTSPTFNKGDSSYYKFEGNEDTVSRRLDERGESPHGELEEEDGVKGDSEMSNKIKKQKKTRSTQTHNHNERQLRRERIKLKMKTLQELIPYCSKRDKLSTFDDAIKYIKTLQNQIQVMAIEGYSTLNSTKTTASSPAPFPQTCPPGSETLYENEGKRETPGFLAGFPDPYFLPVVCGLPAPDGFSVVENPLYLTSPMGITPPLCPTSYPLDFASVANTTPLCSTSLESRGSSSSS
ncbi:transcription factor PIF5-like [Salvia divinorum]|uniref:Transcription factor PIF5-like n=1 Tax=Salvia divinorum TaxID=28513 RepID=A0ABD1HLP1_SALDI